MAPTRRNLLWVRMQEKSNRVGAIRLYVSPTLRQAVSDLGPALASGSPQQVQPVVQTIANEICHALQVPPVTVLVDRARPYNRRGELHGLYSARQDSQATITLWMLTAKRQKVAAFKTFLRTLLHELCHHLDYHLLHLDESVHCEGFYKRESSLFHQITRHLNAVR